MSNNLGRTTVLAGDSGKEVTLEQSLGILDGALSDEIVFTWSGADGLKTASTAQTQQALCVVFEGSTSGTPTFKFGSVQRGVMLVKNDMAVSVDISDYAGNDTLTILSGQTIAIYVTADGIATILESQASLTVENVEDVAAAMLTGGSHTNISVTYDDVNGTIDLAFTGTLLTQEDVEDFAAAMFTGGTHSGISFSYNDATGKVDATVSASLTQEQVEDFVAAQFAAGTHTNISFSYNDTTGAISATVTAGITQEQSEDFTAALFAAGSHTGIAFTYNDGTPSIDAAVSVEFLQDTTAAMLTGGTHSGISFSYNDATGLIDATVSVSGLTQENVEDYVAAQFAAGTHDGVSFSYNDGTGAISATAKPKECIAIACSDESTALTTGTAKTTFRMPYAFTLTEVRASVTTAPTGASLLTVDINEAGVSILSTKLTFDASEKTTTTAATPAVISDTSLADDAEMTVDIDQVGSTVAGAGLKIYLIGHRT